MRTFNHEEGNGRLEGCSMWMSIEFTEEDVSYINKAVKKTLISHGYLDEGEGFNKLDNFKWEIKVKFSREYEEFVTMENTYKDGVLNE